MNVNPYITTLWTKRTGQFEYPNNPYTLITNHLTLVYNHTLESFDVLNSMEYKPIQAIFKVLCRLYFNSLTRNEITTEVYIQKILTLLSNQSNVGELAVNIGVSNAYINAIHNFAKFSYDYILSSHTLVTANSRAEQLLSRFDSMVTNPILSKTNYTLFPTRGN